MRAGSRGATALTVLLVSLSAAGCDSARDGPGPTAPGLVEEGSLVVCAEVPYAPFVTVQEDDDYSGFEVDLLRTVAARLDLDLEVRPTPYAALDTGRALRNERCDVAAGALSVTRQRREHMAFTDPHFDVMLSLLVPSGSDVGGLADLSGRRLAVQQGTSAVSYARQQAPPDAVVAVLPSDQTMIDALRGGRVDAILQDLPVNLAHTGTGRFEVVERYPTGQEYAFAVRRDATSLRRSLDSQLSQVRLDGDYREIYNTYFFVG